MKLTEMKREELEKFLSDCKAEYASYQAENLKLDMSRGKPSPKQLDLSMDLMDCLKRDDYKAESGLDCRNYGVLDGIPEAKEFFSKMLGTSPSETMVFGNSSLNVMYWAMSVAMTNGVMGGKPWGQQGEIKFLCPVPGYDRHMAGSQHFDVKIINVPMNNH